MSQPPYAGPPYPGQPYPGPPPAGRPPTAATTRRRRPSAWWFALPLTMIVLAVAAFPLLLWRAVDGVLKTDGVVAVDGRAHEIRLADPGPHLLWMTSGEAARCTVSAGGSPLSLAPPGESWKRSQQGRSERGVAVFDADSTSVEVTCTGRGAAVRVGPKPDLGGFFGGIVATVLVPLVLGSLGLVLLIVLVVLYATGRPRNETATDRGGIASQG